MFLSFLIDLLSPFSFSCLLFLLLFSFRTQFGKVFRLIFLVLFVYSNLKLMYPNYKLEGLMEGVLFSRQIPFCSHANLLVLMKLYIRISNLLDLLRNQKEPRVKLQLLLQMNAVFLCFLFLELLRLYEFLIQLSQFNRPLLLQLKFQDF